jgi:putative acetyltransferase
MKTDYQIRPETAGDEAAIARVTEEAFRTLEASNQTEQYILEALRAAGALTISLVAEQEGRILGHVAFSPIQIADGTEGWFGLGPVSVAPVAQRKGIGTALIRAGLERLKSLGAQGCCVVGHPGYYERFGFEHPRDLTFPGVPPEVFFALEFRESGLRGQVSFHPAFAQTGPVPEDPASGGGTRH